MVKIEDLNEIQLDALKEIGNIGCLHAATAISQMTNKKIDITVPKIQIKKIIELNVTLNNISDRHEKEVGVYLELTNGSLGSILFLISYSNAISLADLLMFQGPGNSKKLDEMRQSAIMEIGNIVVSSYANALGEFLDTTIMLSPPTFSINMVDAFLAKITKILGKNATNALIFDTIFKEENNLFKSYFILLPSPKSVDVLLEKLASCIPKNSDAETIKYLDSLSKKGQHKK